MPKLTKRIIDGIEAPEQERFVWDSEVKGFGVRVKSTGIKSFVLKYRMGPKTRRHTICKVGSPYTVDEARTVAADLLRGVRNGIDPGDVKAEDRAALTIRELADLYLTEGKAWRPNKKASSWANDASVINRHIKPLVGKRLGRELRPADITKFLGDVTDGKTAAVEKTKARGKAVVRGGKRAASMATITLRGILQFAVDTHRLRTNAAAGVVLHKTVSRERFLSEQEVAFVAEALNEMEDDALVNSTMADAIRLLMVTGARRMEVLALEWSWVDLSRGIARLPDSKTGAKVIMLASTAAAIIARQPRKSGSPYVFPAARGDGHVVGVPKVWGQVKTRATVIAKNWAVKEGLDPATAPDLSDVRIHDLRHSFASFAVADGSALLMVGRVLGHRSARTTEIYAHLRDDPLKAVAERTGRKIALAMGPDRQSAKVVTMSDRRKRRP